MNYERLKCSRIIYIHTSLSIHKGKITSSILERLHFGMLSLLNRGMNFSTALVLYEGFGIWWSYDSFRLGSRPRYRLHRNHALNKQFSVLER